MGVRRDFAEKFVFPEETHYNPEKYPDGLEGKLPWVTCRDAIGDLDYPLPEDEQMQAGSKHKDLLKLVPPGDNYLFFTICAMNSASQTTFSPTNTYPFMVDIPRRRGAVISTRKISVSPGTTF